MRIAYISYEYPPDIPRGGIATYLEQIATIMRDRGHEISIWCGSHFRETEEVVGGIRIIRVKCQDSYDFSNRVVERFRELHGNETVDLIEAPEINGNGLELLRRWPDIPSVVRLHTPVSIIMDGMHRHIGLGQKLRFVLGALRRGKWDLGYWRKADPKNDRDYQSACAAWMISSPSVGLKEEMQRRWKLPDESITVIPNPYVPHPDLLTIPVKSSTGRVTYYGRLNIQKGALVMAKVCELISQKRPDCKLRFLGSDGQDPGGNGSMADYLRQRLGRYPNIEIITDSQYEDLAAWLKETDVCVFPSHFESFSYTCAESVAAGRAVVGSKRGGMPEVMGGEGGIAVDPDSPRQIADSIIALLDDPERRWAMGNAARDRILLKFSAERIGEITNVFYDEVVAVKKVAACV